MQVTKNWRNCLEIASTCHNVRRPFLQEKGNSDYSASPEIPDPRCYLYDNKGVFRKKSRHKRTGLRSAITDIAPWPAR